MDVWIIAAVIMLVMWAVGTFAFTGPGWIHLLLTAGLSVLVWRISARGVHNESRPRQPR